MATVTNTQNFKNPRDRRFTEPSAKILRLEDSLYIKNKKVVGEQQSAVTDAALNASQIVNGTGATADANASLIAVADSSANTNFATIAFQYNSLRSDVSNNVARFNDLLTKLEAHGLIASS